MIKNKSLKDYLVIKINIPNNNFNERKYIIDIIFGEFLGLDHSIKVGSSNYEIVLENGNRLIFEDHFFNQYPNELEYLKLESITSKVEFVKNNFIAEDDIPIIYGNDKLNIQDSKIICGIDIFASSFFMLTRWEEYVNKNRDSHDRFSATESLAWKNNFLDRPVVNEYVEMLWNILKYLGVDQKRKEQKYQLYLTHDVDVPLKYPTVLSGFREVIGDILKRKDFKLLVANLSRKIKTTLKLEKDPFDTFDYLMDISENMAVKSYFFFMGKGVTEFDNFYKSSDKFIGELIKKIKDRDHYIGIHPSYNAYNNLDQFKKEKEELEINLQTSITFGRAHYLRFEVPTTWQIWEDNGMEWDSSCGYPDREGFRCGVCYSYSVFNILTRKKLALKERPLAVMEGSFVSYQPDISPDEMEKKIIYLMDRVKKYHGEFIFLWHNSSFNTPAWSKYQEIYKRVLQ